MTWWEVVGWGGALALGLSRWHLNLLRSRLLSLLGSLGLAVCALGLGVWPLVAGCLIHIGVALWKLWLLQARREDRAFQVLEVDPMDEYLRYVLRIHGQDILSHNPGFVWDGAAPGRSALVLQHGPETIGVVLFRTEPGEDQRGIAYLELDYVTPRYRNLAPARFLFLQSDFFATRGIHRVVSPPSGRTSTYYERLGFTREGDHYVVDLPLGR